MKISVDGEEREVDKDAVLGDVVELSSGCVAGIIKEVEQVVQEKEREYQVETDKGDFTIGLNDSQHAEQFVEEIESIEELGVRWSSKKIAALGPFKSNVPIQKTNYNYQVGDIFFGVSGLDNDNTYLMLAREEHTKGYGTGGGVIGRIKRGKHMVDYLKEGDSIKEISQVKSREERYDSFYTNDPETELAPGMQIYSKISIKLGQAAPLSSEYFLRKTENNYLEVGETTDTYLKCNGRIRNLPAENNVRRGRGVVTVRNEGDGRGNIYLYKKDRPMHTNHNVIGEVVSGVKLLDILDEGCRIMVETRPKRMLSIGLTQEEAGQLFGNNGIKHKRVGETGDEAVVIRQEPRLTLDLKEGGVVETYGVDPERIMDVELYYEDASETTDYFKRVSRLISEDVGQLEVYFASQKISNVMFKGDQDLAGNLKPENTPNNQVAKGEIGITNMSKPNKGMIGIRLEDSDRYGPTGEGFKATNITGKVVNGLENLTELNDGDKIYIREIKPQAPAPEKEREKEKEIERESDFGSEEEIKGDEGR
ncbi:methanogenesis marker 3 protein [Methanonatronarchaeum sp. AMET-Sl]|uniref:methyl-coenzyme M reductase-associated protein Mmp3 n=1 Tax=Methanonatronarchaeum sp. AMET-Sl TaxID=3037654 RepID=UPI00244DAAE5|nr:methanogenesis marker 3 protein [Methanonatronarchaeum sp. AMET-Sl]WGI17714.1 methanogenesis marker 3 protein [Methanonatronarchaeum sp. AMET-Sl]